MGSLSFIGSSTQNIKELAQRPAVITHELKSSTYLQHYTFPLYLCMTRCLQKEYEQLRQQHGQSAPAAAAVSGAPDEADLLAEAKLLRQHKGRLEARMQILEDHNKQLESQLYRLRQLLHQVTQQG